MDKKIEKYIKPFLKDNKIVKSDFDSLFGAFDNEKMDKVLEFVSKNEIQIVGDIQKANVVFYDDKGLNKLSNEALCVMYQRGNSVALEVLIHKNKRLVYSRVRKYIKYYKHDLSEDDLVQEGTIGLMKAVKKFNNSLGFNLSTYAIWWIDQSILRAIADFGFTIRVPVHMFENINLLNRIYRDLASSGLSDSEIKAIVMERMNLSEDRFYELKSIYHNIMSLSSLNSPVGEDGDTELEEMIEDSVEKDTFDIVADKLLEIDLQDVLSTLTLREQKIIKLRFGLKDNEPRTLESVGEVLGVTRERIRQIEAKALRKLRHPARAKYLRGYMYEE